MSGIRFFAGRTILLSILALIVVSVVGAAGLQLSSNNRLFFSEQDEYYADFLGFEDKYGANSELVFLLSCGSACPPELDRKAVKKLESMLWDVRGVRSTSSLISFPVAFDDTDGEYTVTEPYSDLCEASPQCVALREELLRTVRNRFISSNGRDYVVVASLHLDSDVPSVVADTMGDIAEVRSEFYLEFPGYSLAYTGAVPMMDAFFVASQGDLTVLIPIALFVMFFALQFVFRDVRLSLLLLGHAAFAVLVTLGVMGYTGAVLNTATSTLPLVVVTLVIATNMHIYIDVLKQGLVGSVSERRGALLKIFGSNWLPISLATLTTMLGLASMLSVSSPPLSELGVWAAFGVFIGYAFAFLVAPSIFVFLGSISQSEAVAALRVLINRYAKKIEFAGSHSILLVLGACFLLYGLSRVDIDEDFVNYFAIDSEFRAGAIAVEDSVHSPYHIEIDFGSENGSVMGVESRELGREVAAYLRGLPNVVNVISLYDYLDLVALGLNLSHEQQSAMGASEFEQLLLAFELGLAEGQSLARLVTPDRSYLRMSVLLRDVSMKDIRNIEAEFYQWFSERTAAVNGDQRVLVTGEGLVTAKLSVESIQQMAFGVLISLLLSGLVLAYALRQPSLAVFLLAIAVTTTLLGVAVWSVIVGSIGLSCTLVIAVTVGVVVDDAIHMLSRYSGGVEDMSLTASEAAAYSVHRVGPAIAFSTLVLSLGFSVLGFSGFAMNRDYGIGAAVVVVIALGFNLFVTPKLLSLRATSS